jgi:dTDP-glucose 4,6-dehydratase
MSFFDSILVTGGAGFIGSNFVRRIVTRHPECAVTVLDALTYAGNLENLSPMIEDRRVTFVKGSIADPNVVRAALEGRQAVFNFAAETHVDRSIREAGTFVETDVLGTYTLLRVASERGLERFIHISTDEVYGSSEGASFTEQSPLKPGNPYSASKGGGDLMCQAFFKTFGIPVVITRSSNNYGPYQHVEKFIPLFITNTIEGNELPLYGDGMHRRDWIYVEDNCAAIELLGEKGTPGEVYNICAGRTHPNLEVAEKILDLLGAPRSRIVLIEDRKGHDRAYEMDGSKLEGLGWRLEHEFDQGLEKTVSWYKKNESWWRRVKSGAFREYYQKFYGDKIRKGKKRGA